MRAIRTGCLSVGSHFKKGDRFIRDGRFLVLNIPKKFLPGYPYREDQIRGFRAVTRPAIEHAGELRHEVEAQARARFMMGLGVPVELGEHQ